MVNFSSQNRSAKYIISSAALIAAGMMGPQMAAAQTSDQGAYASIGIALLSADLDLSNLDVQGNNVDLGEEDASIFLLNGRLGYRVNKFFAAEVEGGFGLGGDSLSRNLPVPVDGFGTVNVDLDADINVENYIAGFARAILPLTDKFDLFIRGGYGTAQAEANLAATTALLGGANVTAEDSASIDGFAYGVGAEYHISNRQSIRLDGSAINSDVQFISLSYGFKF